MRVALMYRWQTFGLNRPQSSGHCRTIQKFHSPLGCGSKTNVPIHSALNCNDYYCGYKRALVVDNRLLLSYGTLVCECALDINLVAVV